jgi:multiple sugar transport system permease protein
MNAFFSQRRRLLDVWYLRNSLVYLAMGLALVYTLFPMLWMVFNSFKRRIDIISIPVVYWPDQPTLNNYIEVFVNRGFFIQLGNSLIIAITVTTISLVFGTFAAYGLARFTYFANFKQHISFWILSTRMIPPIVTLVPLYILFSTVGLLNTKLSLIIAYTGFNLPFVVWMMKGYFSEIPHEMEESAMVDGDTRFGAMLRIAIPLAKPSIAATAIFSFLLSWNEMLLALILSDTAASQTFPVALGTRISQHQIFWGEINAGGVVAILPVIILAFIVQRHLVRGLSFGAIKG